ncbi:MAG: hypothetical protein WBA97_19750 [Actinophytocola sp.]|uniref:hypothetical protein n=1 Tax=Actinophytocola sp. TaxID=1872138 RepID=UPI003C70901D
MPVAFDTAGMERHDERTWFDPRTGDQVSLTYIGMEPDIPAPLDDLPQLRRKLAEETAETGSIIEAHVVRLGGVPALFQLIKLPIPGQDTGLAFIAAFTVPRATCSAVLRIQCAEGQATGLRETAVAAQVGFENCLVPHPYAPEVRGQLPYNVADEANWDQQFPDHPLTRARAWAHRTLASAQVDPQFVALPPFEPAPAPPPAPVPPAQAQAPAPAPAPAPAEDGDALHTVLVGLPLAGYLPLWQENGVSYWRMSDPEAVRARLGAGVESRSEIDARRLRESARFSPSRGTLFLMDRDRDETGHLGGTSTQLTPATEEEAYAAVDDRALSELYTWLGEVVLAAVRRGEFVAVESGGWQVPMTPVVLVMLRTDGKEWHSVVEASPVPEGALVWRDKQPVEGNTQVLVSPATDQTVRASGLLIRFAVTTWGVHPLQLGLSFGQNPTL